MNLTVLAEPGSPAGADPSVYHFRPEEADTGQGITHVFTLKNENGKTLTIARVDSSCSCTTALLEAGSSPAPPSGAISLAPGEEARLKVTVGIGDAAQGTIDKMVWVRVAGQADPAATLHIEGTIDPPVMFVPMAIDFGDVSAGRSMSRVMFVGVSPRYLGADPNLISSIPDLAISPDPGESPAGFPASYRVKAYRVTVPADAPMGPIDGSLSLGQSQAPDAAPAGALVFGAGPSVKTAVVNAPSLPAASVPVRGHVRGDLSASPETAIFGTVAAGQGASIPVTVASHTGKDLSAMRFTSDQPWLSARLTGPAQSAGGWILQLTIAPNAPAGAQTGRVVGETAGGQKLAVPVIAYIVSEK